MHHEFTSDDEIERIGSGLIARDLPKAEWTHAAHFAAALWLIRRGEVEAMPAHIRAYNEATGVANTDTSGYHETITQASLRAAHAALRASLDDALLYCVVNTLMRSRLGRSDWLLAHWSKPVLFSAAARRAWTAPDLSPLPYPAFDAIGTGK